MQVEKSILDLCEFLGSDIYYTQGAGGNVSIKNENTLLIKASGKWLADANKENIFTKVDLSSAIEAVDKKMISGIKAINTSLLKPSIETCVHAILPWKYIVHIHHLNAIVHLILEDSDKLIKQKLAKFPYKYGIIRYVKPGEKLATEIKAHLKNNPGNQILLLQNHGVFFCSDCILELKDQIKSLDKFLSLDSTQKERIDVNSKIDFEHIKSLEKDGYFLFPSKLVQSIVRESRAPSFLKKHWNICPDHIVFMGPKAFVYSDFETFKKSKAKRADIIFISYLGVFSRETPTLAKIAQLEAYVEIYYRIKPTDKIQVLNKTEVEEIANWESEKYRLNLSK